MKKVLFVLLSVCGSSCVASDEVLEITAPTEFVDFNELDQSIELWRQELFSSLNEQEIQLVSHLLQLGSLFSLVDLQARQAVRSLLPAVWQLHEEIISGRKGLPILNQIAQHGEQIHQLIIRHDMALKEWNEWTNAVEVCDNKKVLDFLEQVNEHVALTIERCIKANEWQQIASFIPAVLDQQNKTGNLLYSLCAFKTVENDEVGDSQDDDTMDLEVLSDQSMMRFSWLVNAASLYTARSWESIEAITQLFRYQEELLTISGVIYNKYLRVLNQEQQEQEVFVLA